MIDTNSSGHQANSNGMIEEIKGHIVQGHLDLPPIPDIMQRLAEKIEKPLISIDEIVECIADQILVSKILRICNSPFYWHTKTISTLKEAVVFIGVKAVMSIVTMHALSSFSPRNAVEISKVLQHCLVCGMISRQIALELRGNYDLAFICGLLHDIGKTVLLDMLSDYDLSDEIRTTLIKEHHGEVGYLLAEKWNYGEDIKEAIRFHHAPEQAQQYSSLVEVIFLSNILTNGTFRSGDDIEMLCSGIDIGKLDIDMLIDQVEKLDQDAHRILSIG